MADCAQGAVLRSARDCADSGSIGLAVTRHKLGFSDLKGYAQSAYPLSLRFDFSKRLEKPKHFARKCNTNFR